MIIKKTGLLMESIFDYNVTEHELDYLFVEYKEKNDYERFTKNYNKCADLYLLFNLRGNKSKANYYLDRVAKQY